MELEFDQDTTWLDSDRLHRYPATFVEIFTAIGRASEPHTPMVVCCQKHAGGAYVIGFYSSWLGLARLVVLYPSTSFGGSDSELHKKLFGLSSLVPRRFLFLLLSYMLHEVWLKNLLCVLWCGAHDDTNYGAQTECYKLFGLASNY